MPCYSPLPAFMNSEGEIVWSRKNGAYPFPLPCGKCIGCRKRRSEDWALRCFHESLSYEFNSFLTLTFDDDHLPSDGSLNRKDVQKFIKRLRERLSRTSPETKIRYFACGEYGEHYGRPHYHIIIFNYGFPDKYVFQVKNGNYLYRSDELEKLWPFGQSSIGVASMATMRYCIKYSVKAQFDKELYPHLLPPFIQMSTRPAIGENYFLKYKHELLDNGCVVSNGRKFAIPRAYTKKYDDEEKEQVAEERATKSKRVKQSAFRLRDIETVKKLNAKLSGDDYGE